MKHLPGKLVFVKYDCGFHPIPRKYDSKGEITNRMVITKGTMCLVISFKDRGLASPLNIVLTNNGLYGEVHEIMLVDDKSFFL